MSVFPMSNHTHLGAQFYDLYRFAGPTPGLISVGAVFGSLALSGNLLNAFFIYVTFRNKQLRGTSNYLLAMNSFFELIQGTGHYIFCYSVFTGKNFIPLLESVVFQLQALFGYAAMMLNMFETAVDRLLSVLAPNFHERVAGRTYLTLLTLACGLPGGLYAGAMLSYALGDPTEAITGHSCDLAGPVSYVWYYSLVMLWSTVAIYVLLGFIVLKKSSQQSKRNKQVFKSLAAICLLMAGTNIICLTNRILTTEVFNVTSPVALWYVGVSGGAVANISGLANTPILYVFSSEYRKVMQTEFRRLFKGWVLPKLVFVRVQAPNSQPQLQGTTNAAMNSSTRLVKVNQAASGNVVHAQQAWTSSSR